MDINEFLRSRHGAARTETLRKAGFTQRALAKAVSDGTAARLHRGVYTSGDADPDVVAAFRADGVLTCISAARFYGLWTLESAEELHLSCSTGLARRRVAHHGARQHPDHPYLPVAGVADVLIHALRCLPELDALVLVQSAVSLALLSTDFLKSRLPGNRNGRVRATLDAVLPRSDSLLEVLAHTHFTRAGLGVQMHADVPEVGEVDCLVNECLIVELDGGTHLEGKQVKKDQYRNNAAMRMGLLSLRYYYADVVHHPERMVAEVKAVLRNREVGRYAPARYAPGWVPPSS
ncbi:type IV toxin-antitoxin system AbiEi family antitoxin domain-containing protein [Arthrobacter sp. AK01]|uniref:type IV toxin-antitoxin system AbiEi family antitoxin domain-containing protein n=1 Tax=Arthrobacter sp. AK01 TaxID=2894084 RepID=UPI001E614B47|nr:type IV toxin-antitoxin system AbiEi family antitoxin domain-containing protein [Arthrobacter sp. AK01]MCD4850966.1 type IV toxin-antitoxin system AbiEi family antitoxin domain-containing protein [Arthrobacter sp. AK01]